MRRIQLQRKSLVLHGEIKTPPLSEKARLEAGGLIRHLQKGFALELPHSRPMPDIGERVHELRITDKNQTWRIIYRIDAEEIVVAEIFSKKTPTTPLQVIKTCRKRFREYDGD